MGAAMEAITQWAICDPVAWARMWVKHRGASIEWIADATRERERVEAAGGMLAVITFPGGGFCFVEWQGLSVCGGLLHLEDSVIADAYRLAQFHTGGRPPLLKIRLIPLPESFMRTKGHV